MADKNLHDIKIDELDSPKKTPLKNILTLLALLFIILVISVVITKLILNTDEGTTIENNDSKVELTDSTQDANATGTATAIAAGVAGAGTAALASVKDAADKKESTDTKVPVLNANVPERNLTSAIKTPLSSHEPKEIKTYKTPKKNNESTSTTTAPKKAPVKQATAPKKAPVKQATAPKKAPVKQATAPKKAPVKQATAPKKTVTAAPKKEYIAPKKTTTSTKKVSYLGGQQKLITSSYYIKVGTYRDPSSVIAKVKKNNFNYSLVKVENDKTLTRVLVGPFFSRNQAKSQLAKVKANILTGAYITKAK